MTARCVAAPCNSERCGIGPASRAPGNASAKPAFIDAVLTVFDGHNDTLTRADADDFVAGRAGGHIDLARARAGGLGGGIFACYTATPGAGKLLEDAQPGGYFIEVSASIGQDLAAPH